MHKTLRNLSIIVVISTITVVLFAYYHKQYYSAPDYKLIIGDKELEQNRSATIHVPLKYWAKDNFVGVRWHGNNYEFRVERYIWNSEDSGFADYFSVTEGDIFPLDSGIYRIKVFQKGKEGVISTHKIEVIPPVTARSK